MKTQYLILLWAILALIAFIAAAKATIEPIPMFFFGFGLVFTCLTGLYIYILYNETHKQ